MIGFSLMHSGTGIVLLFAFYAALGWGALTIVLAIFSPKRRNLTNIAGVLVITIAAALIFAPSGVWVRLFAGRLAQGPHATEFLVDMAGLGDIKAVEALLDKGVPINASDSRGLRPIEAAQNANQIAMRDFLAKRGATDKRF
jgi:hypothetical protein